MQYWKPGWYSSSSASRGMICRHLFRKAQPACILRLQLTRGRLYLGKSDSLTIGWHDTNPASNCDLGIKLHLYVIQHILACIRAPWSMLRHFCNLSIHPQCNFVTAHRRTDSNAHPCNSTRQYVSLWVVLWVKCYWNASVLWLLLIQLLPYLADNN
jgi:hypothetical protein